MSDVTQPRTIPVGILVSITDSSSRKRAGRPRKIVSSVPRPAPVPWREMLAGISAVWLVLIVGVALWAGASNPAPAPAKEPVVAAPAVEPVVAVNLPAPAGVEPADLVPTPPEPEPQPSLLDRLPSVPAPVALRTPLTPLPEALAPPDVPKTCTARLGTQIDFVVDPPEAFRRAREQNKLVFMIHLSGNFEDQEFT